jgi:alkanesulfonate monooxygenase SsuD/methylene tetrahydromethanopterin reductase-like flavin-dependent oxidoreductase (luciferase family)
MTSIKIGVGLPVGVEHPEPTAMDGARFAEDLGFESLWMPEVLIGDGTPALDPMLALTAAAAVTERVGLGFGVLTAALRPAAWLATQIATLQRLSAGRVLLGVGSGGFPDSPFWQAVGVPGAERGARTDATLRALPGLLAGKPVVLGDGLPPVTLAPAAAMPPVLAGGNSGVAMRRAIEYGGWFPSLIAPDDLAVAVARLRERADAEGRPMPSVTVGGHLIAGDDASAREARESFVRTLVETHGMPRETAERLPMIARDAAEFAEVATAYADAGADRFVTGPDNGDWRDGLRLMAEGAAMPA